MTQLCGKCSRNNPPEAVYCYYDGFVLGGHERRGGPVAVGAQLFNSPFVFPTGRTCRSFDELALACQEEWAAAIELLREGYLESFLGGLGRVDLARTAKAAARFPDPERGLDQLLATLPSSVLEDPKLRAEPQEINLGLIESDKERVFELELENAGMRLLYGSVSSSDAGWLTLGDAPGSTEKHFHLTHESRIPVRIRTERIRAEKKPFEAKLLIESNGGSATVLVRGEKPIKPFPDGPLAGVKSPRQVGEKAQANPREVAPLFESGAVEQWYQSNGWVYPVKIPAASGVAAIQQFFEALGMSKPPKVEISTTDFTLTVDPGANIPLQLEVSTQEKRPVFAHVTSNVPWLEISRPKFNGKSVTVNMSIPTVPDRPGETLEGELTVLSNGNKRFVVPVRLSVTGERRVAAALSLDDDLDDGLTAMPPPPPPPPPMLEGAVRVPPPPPPLPRRESKPRAQPVFTPAFFLHAIPAVVLAFAVLGVVIYDLVRPAATGPTISSEPPEGPDYDPKSLVDARPRIHVQYHEDQRFGIVLDKDGKGEKRLTGFARGDTNSTLVKIGGDFYRYGFPTAGARWKVRPEVLAKPYWGKVSEMEFYDKEVSVRQHVQVVPGQTGLLDTCLVYFKITNYGKDRLQQVGMRVLIDTRVGENDGTPFTVPGLDGAVTDFIVLPTPKDAVNPARRLDHVPDYLEVVEKPDSLRDPGTTARIGLRGMRWGKVQLTDPDKVVICRYHEGRTEWAWEPQPMEGDSCVVIYWTERDLDRGEQRELAFTYGLGKVEIGDNLSLSTSRQVLAGQEFTVTAIVHDTSAERKVTLALPEGAVELTRGEAAEKTVPKGGKLATWRVRAKREQPGPVTISATSEGSKAEVKVRIKGASIFG